MRLHTGKWLLLFLAVPAALANAALPVVRDALTDAATPAVSPWLRYLPSGVGLSQQSTGRLGKGQDPGIVFFRGSYYLVQAAGGTFLTVFRSSDLQTLMTDEQFHWELTKELVDNVEAPDIDIITDPTDGSQKLGIYISRVRPFPGFIKVVVTDDPAEGFEDKGYLKGVSGYDAHYLEHPNGNAYLFYSDFATLQIIQMSDPWTTQGSNVTISRATLPWEMEDGYPPINEAPATVISGETLNLIYSANNWASVYYLCGRLTADVNSDPMDPSSWTKDTSGPVFKSANGLLGPGSGTFFTNGLQRWWAYGCFTDPSRVERHIRAQTVSFNSNEEVVLGEPV
ncbi:hypothetical protein WJX73_003672 [Symbiochloris irregularis]|uniref:Uncharacterized protein n=1 Tax=Symbiochloris irregularis TaxID=706552 RepID=A0AAW1PEA0_9CHLO